MVFYVFFSVPGFHVAYGRFPSSVRSSDQETSGEKGNTSR